MSELKIAAVKLFAVFLVAVLTVGMLASTAFVPAADAAVITTDKKSYEIAVVYDNSGSMYTSKAWSRAKYAMEIFASMLDYDAGDKLVIFPMWEVVTDGTKPENGGSYAPIVINSKDDINKITYMYTTNADNTPFKPVLEAEEYLKSSNATDKWIILLTDGKINQSERGESKAYSAATLTDSLVKISSKGINVQYLGFDAAPELKSNASKNFYATKSTDTSLKDDLIGICNSIFQRSVLDSKYLSGTTLKLDLSMRKIIVFAQGSSAKITSLTDASGNSVNIKLDSGQRKYNDYSAVHYENAKVDDTLMGQVVTFDACKKGTYTLNYSGADKIQVFYEPDVDIEVKLYDSDGIEVTSDTEELIAGEYTIKTKIIDSATKEDVTNHELLGGNVSLKTSYKTSSDSDFRAVNDGKITLEPDSSTEILVEGEYLGKYKISSRDSKDLEWLQNIVVREPKVSFKLSAKVQQKDSWYKLSDHDKWKPIKVTLTVDGNPLSDEELLKTDFKVEQESGEELPYRYEIIPGESAYNVYIGQDDSGKYVDPDTGEYKLKFSATYVDEFGNNNPAKSTATFEVARLNRVLSWILKNLWWILIILFLILVVLYILFRKALPNRITKSESVYTYKGHSYGDNPFSYKIKGNSKLAKFFSKKATITVSSTDIGDFAYACGAKIYVEPVYRWATTRSNRRKIKVVKISLSGDRVTGIEIGGHAFTKEECRAGLSQKIEVLNPSIVITTDSAEVDLSYETLFR